MFLFTILAFFSISAQAQDIQGDIELVEAAQLVINSQEQEALITSLVSAKDKSSMFYFPSKDGRIFVLSKSGQSSLYLDVSSLLPDRFLYADGLGLYGLSFHPNFTKTGQLGFRKLYTAHAERVEESFTDDDALGDESVLGDSRSAHHYDVIYEWSVDPYNQVQPESAREVLRIARRSSEQVIVSMGYDPNIKAWNSDFGNLYIGLGGVKEESSAPSPSAKTVDLSGTILRINPLQEGMSSYKAADNNPYSSGGKYPPEVWAYGLKKLQGFSWDSSGKRSMFIVDLVEGTMKLYQGVTGTNYAASERASGQPLLESNSSDNLTRRSPSTPLAIYNLQAEDYSSVGAVYRGNLLQSLDGSYIFADLNTETLLSVPSFYLTQQEHTKVLPVDVSNFSDIAEQNSNKGILISTDKKGDVYLFNTKSKRLYTLAPAIGALADAQDNKEARQPEESEESYLWLFILFMFGALILVTIFVLRYKRYSSLSHLNNHYIKIRVNTDENLLTLFKKGEKENGRQINLSDITGCQLLLNGNQILMLDSQSGNGLDQSKEDQLRKILNSETIGKMGKDRTLHLEFALITKEDSEAIHVSVYYRKGNRRLTRHSYQNSAEESLNLCWLFSQQVNPEETGERTPIEPVRTYTKPQSAQENGQVESPALDRSVQGDTDSLTADNANRTNNTESINAESLVAPNRPESPEQLESSSRLQPLPPPGTTDKSPSIVSELEKLVELRQKALLTEQEFALAKKKLLGDL